MSSNNDKSSKLPKYKNTKNPDRRLGVYYTVDKNPDFHLYNLVSVFSLVKNLPKEAKLDILILETEQVSDEELFALREIPEITGHKDVHVMIYNLPDWHTKINDRAEYFFPTIVFARLGVPYYISDYDQLLYVDSDTMFMDSIMPIFDILDDDDTIGGVRDIQLMKYENKLDQIKIVMGPSRINDYSRFINAGILLINVKNYIKNIPSQPTIDTINDISFGHFPDQEFINERLSDFVTLIPPQYNFTSNFLDNPNIPVSDEFAEFLKGASKNVVIKHFAAWPHLTRKPAYPFYPFGSEYDRKFYDYLIEFKSKLPKIEYRFFEGKKQPDPNKSKG